MFSQTRDVGSQLYKLEIQNPYFASFVKLAPLPRKNDTLLAHSLLKSEFVCLSITGVDLRYHFATFMSGRMAEEALKKPWKNLGEALKRKQDLYENVRH